MSGARRYDRRHFLAFGLLPAVNAVAIALYGLHISTAGLGGAGRAIPALVGILIVVLLSAMVAAIRRGRDLGFPMWLTVVAFWFGLSMGPVLLVFLGYLVFAPPKHRDGDKLPPMDFIAWLWAAMNLAWPWAVLAVLSKLL